MTGLKATIVSSISIVQPLGVLIFEKIGHRYFGNMVKDVKLLPGMVITIEPGIYLPNLGGARIEDTLVVREDGCINLIKRSHNPIQI